MVHVKFSAYVLACLEEGQHILWSPAHLLHQPRTADHDMPSIHIAMLESTVAVLWNKAR